MIFQFCQQRKKLHGKRLKYDKTTRFRNEEQITFVTCSDCQCFAAIAIKSAVAEYFFEIENFWRRSKRKLVIYYCNVDILSFFWIPMNRMYHMVKSLYVSQYDNVIVFIGLPSMPDLNLKTFNRIRFSPHINIGQSR